MSNLETMPYIPDYSVTPGDVLCEHIADIGMSQADLACRTGLSKKTVNEIIKGKAPITPDTALKFERVLGQSARFWLNLESNYQEDCARLAAQSETELNLKWLASFPIREMAGFGWLPKCEDKIEQLEALLRFFGVASPKQWKTIWECACIAYRQSKRYEVRLESISSWLREGELEAKNIECKRYDAKVFKEVLKKIRALTQEGDPGIFVPKLVELCASAGVAVVFVPELTKTGISGATRWIDGRPVIQLSLRYKRNDHLWFSFFHESGHILEHARKLLFLEGGSVFDEDKEMEADRFAQDFLVAPREWQCFIEMNSFTALTIKRFAKSVGIAPGIIVGRLQHDNLLPFNQMHDLFVSYAWNYNPRPTH
jgi:addiction module HigA family antidote